MTLFPELRAALPPVVRTYTGSKVGRLTVDMTYAIWSGSGHVKIGHTLNLASRFGAIQSCNPYPLVLVAVTPGGLSVERSIHGRFTHLRAEGEWFRFEDDLRDFLEHWQDTLMKPQSLPCPRPWTVDEDPFAALPDLEDPS